MNEPVDNFKTFGALFLVCAYGAVLGLASGLLLLLAAFLAGDLTIFSGVLLLPLAIYGIPAAGLVGAVCGWYVRRKRKESGWRLLWRVPAMTIPLTLVLGLLVGASGALGDKWSKQLKDMRTVQANYSGHWIRGARTDGSECQTYSSADTAMVAQDSETNITPQVEYRGQQTPEWDQQNRMTVTWWRPVKPEASADDESAPVEMLRATADIPHYRTPYNKVFVVDFLPDDRVRVEAFTAFSFDEPISQPADDQYVAQGTVVDCKDAYCCSPL
jgi:hypothetical protein